MNSILDTTYINGTQLRQPSTVMPAALHAAVFTAVQLVRMNAADKANHHHQYVQTIACALGEPSLPTQLISWGPIHTLTQTLLPANWPVLPVLLPANSAAVTRGP